MNNIFWRLGGALALGLVCGPAGTASSTAFGAVAGARNPDEAVLLRLNDDYAHAFVTSDVGLYQSLLAEDFQAILADGRRIDRAEFLGQAAQPSGVTDFRLQDVAIRAYGDAAVVSALANYRHENGSAVRTRYVTLYIRRQDRWQIVSVQFTRAAAMDGR